MNDEWMNFAFLIRKARNALLENFNSKNTLNLKKIGAKGYVWSVHIGGGFS